MAISALTNLITESSNTPVSIQQKIDDMRLARGSGKMKRCTQVLKGIQSAVRFISPTDSKVLL